VNQSNVAGNAPDGRNFRQTLLSMFGLCFVLIMVALDQTVVGTALPTVVAELNGFDLYAWVGTSYLLASVIVVPIFGKLGDEYGRKPFVVIAIIIFTIASILCGLANSMLQLVLARALQGIGGGILMATAFACIPDLFPDTRERLRWQILFSTAFGLANAFGPSLGGYLTEYWGWRWVFFVNLPVGALSLIFVWRFLPRIRHSADAPSRMDWFGALLVASTLGCLQLFVEWLTQNKPTMILTAIGCIGAVSGIALIWWESRCDNPVLPLSMLKDKILGPVFAVGMSVSFCLFAIIYYAPLLFQGGFGLSPNQAGVLITPLAVFITVGSIINGRIMTRLQSPHVSLYSGLGFFLASTLVMTQAAMTTPHLIIAISMMLGGLGIGLILPNLTLIVQSCASRRQLGVATAMLQSMRMIGSMLGTAIIGSYISKEYVSNINDALAVSNASQLAPWLNDPKILFSHQLVERFIKAMPNVEQGAMFYLTKAQHSLIEAVHESQWLISAFVMVIFWLVHNIPTVNVHERAKDADVKSLR
jgi:EmrB/QacA subfamily drug resistance transporter